MFSNLLKFLNKYHQMYCSTAFHFIQGKEMLTHSHSILKKKTVKKCAKYVTFCINRGNINICMYLHLFSKMMEG